MNLVTLPLATPAQLPPYVASTIRMAFVGFFSSAVTLPTEEQRIIKATPPNESIAAATNGITRSSRVIVVPFASVTLRARTARSSSCNIPIVTEQVRLRTQPRHGAALCRPHVHVRQTHFGVRVGLLQRDPHIPTVPPVAANTAACSHNLDCFADFHGSSPLRPDGHANACSRPTLLQRRGDPP